MRFNNMPHCFKTAAICTFILNTSISVFSQIPDYHLPKIIPQSPAVANFMRYGEIPVNHSTGVPDISIPLYTVTSRKLELPISISYHASGIKVNDRASVVGLGWVLNAGGLVGVTLQGGWEDGRPKPEYTTSAAFKAQRDLLKNNLGPFRNFGSQMTLEMWYNDWQSDRYFAQLPNGQSAVFRYGYLDDNLIMLPYKPWKVDRTITHNPTNNRDEIVGFTIVDDSGTSYSFETKTTDVNVRNWYLTGIISADKTDTIRLVYKEEVNRYWSFFNTSVIDIGSNASIGPIGAGTMFGNDCQFSNAAGSLSITTEPILDSIISATAIVKFTSVADRIDMGTSASPHRIIQMTVYDRHSNEQVKTVTFNERYFGSAANNKRLKLDGISISGNGAAEQHYNFFYESVIELPKYPDGIAAPFSFNEDFWGYYNGKNGHSAIHAPFVPSSYSGGGSVGLPAIPQPFMLGDRSADHTYAKAYMIKEIQYPTGGKTVFDFEPNYALAYQELGENPHAGNVGGFRIQKISNYEIDGTLLESKRYEYSTGITRVISKDLYAYWRRTVYLNGFPINRLIITSNPLLPLNADSGPPVFYEKVTEYKVDSDNQDIGKTVYTYKRPEPEYHAPWDPPQPYAPTYPNVTGDFFEDLTYQHIYERDRGNYQPLLRTKTDYKKEGTTYTRVAKLENMYGAFLPADYNIGMHMNFVSNYLGNENDDYHWCMVLDNQNLCNYKTLQLPFYLYPIDLNATQEFNLLSETKSYTYSPTGMDSLITSVQYTYGSLANYTFGSRIHTKPTEQRKTNSRNELIKTEFKYPADFSATPYTTLVNRNSLTNIIEQKQFKGSHFLQSVKSNYKSWISPYIIEPEYIETTIGSITETRLRYHNIDEFGHAKTVSRENGIKHAYLYDYNNTKPVAEVINAIDSEIAYTSFETDNQGGWDYNQTARFADLTVKTGQYYYKLSHGNITRILSPGKYKLEFWARTGTVNLAGGSIAQIHISESDVNGWVLHQYEITAASNVTLTLSSNTQSIIDEVRLYPAAARMTSYTFNPSIGVTTATDANGVIVYYEYDSFGRLAFVKDANGDIVENYTYNYRLR
jgi:YD repeat-containing protein